MKADRFLFGDIETERKNGFKNVIDCLLDGNEREESSSGAHSVFFREPSNQRSTRPEDVSYMHGKEMNRWIGLSKKRKWWTP